MRLLVFQALPGQVEIPEEFEGKPPTWWVGVRTGDRDVTTGRAILDAQFPVHGLATLPDAVDFAFAWLQAIRIQIASVGRTE